jgi:hypothetical protein
MEKRLLAVEILHQLMVTLAHHLLIRKQLQEKLEALGRKTDQPPG